MSRINGYRTTPDSGDPYHYIRTGSYARILAHEAQAETQSWGKQPWLAPPTVTKALPPSGSADGNSENDKSEVEDVEDEEDEAKDGSEWSVIYRGGKKALESVSD